jgi:O-antigen/teichoic acid export membrane protein
VSPEDEEGKEVPPEAEPGAEPPGELDPASFAEPEAEPGGGSLTDTVVRGVGLAGFGFVSAQALTLGFFLVLARLATPADFGDYAAGSLLVGIGLLFTESGMLAALIHREDRIDEAASTATVSTFLSGILFTALALAASPLIGLAFDSSRVGDIAAASSGLLFVRALLIVPQALLQRRFSFFRRMIVEPISVLVFGAVAIVLCAKGMGPWGLVIGYYAGAVIDVILSWAFIDWRPKLSQVSYSMWRELVAYGRYVLAAHAVMVGTNQLPVFLIGRFSGAGPLGQYRYAERLATTPVGLVIQAGSYVIFPAFARITGERERFRGAMLRSLRQMCALSFPLVILLVPLGVPAAVILFGPVWREAGYATMILAGEAVAGTVTSFASEVLKADGAPQLLTKVHVALFICSSVAMLALLPLGLYGVTAGAAIGSLAASLYALGRVRSLNSVSFRDFGRESLPPLFAALLMAAILTPVEFLLVHADQRGIVVGLLLIIVEGIVGLLIYVAAMAVLAPATMREMRDLLAGMIRRRRTA